MQGRARDWLVWTVGAVEDVGNYVQSTPIDAASSHLGFACATADPSPTCCVSEVEIPLQSVLVRVSAGGWILRELESLTYGSGDSGLYEELEIGGVS